MENPLLLASAMQSNYHGFTYFIKGSSYKAAEEDAHHIAARDEIHGGQKGEGMVLGEDPSGAQHHRAQEDHHPMEKGEYFCQPS